MRQVIPDALVEKAAERLDTLNPECVTTAEDCAREALVAVLPDVRRAVAEEIAERIEADGLAWRFSTPVEAAARIAREVGGRDA